MNRVDQPADDVAFEGEHVGFAADSIGEFARDLNHGAGFEEDVGGALHEAVETVTPFALSGAG